MEDIYIGIDFGTMCAKAGWMRRQMDFSRVTSYNVIEALCYITFDDLDKRVGYTAFDSLKSNAVNTIYDIKNLIGMKYEDCKLIQNKYPFKIVKSDTNNRPMVEMLFNKQKSKFYFEELYSWILKSLVEQIEDTTRRKVKGAVIAIPNKYTDVQRLAVLEAAKMINLNVIQLINETTALAINSADKRMVGKNVLFIDFGAGKLESSLVKVENGSIDVLISDGIENFGGNNFTKCLVDYCVEIFERENGINLKDDNESLCKLFRACENAKCKFQSSNKPEVYIEEELKEKKLKVLIDEHVILSRCKGLYEILRNFFAKMKQIILNRCYNVDGICYSGGCMKMFYVSRILKNCFMDDYFKCEVHAHFDEFILEAATLLASKQNLILNRNLFTFSDVISKDLKISFETDKSEAMKLFVPKYSKIDGTYIFNLKNVRFANHDSNRTTMSKTHDVINIGNTSILRSSSENITRMNLLYINITCNINIIQNETKAKMVTLCIFESDEVKCDMIGTLKIQPDIETISIKYDENGMIKLPDEMFFEYSVNPFDAQTIDEINKRQKIIEDAQYLSHKIYKVDWLCSEILIGLDSPKIPSHLIERIKPIEEYCKSMQQQIKQERSIQNVEKLKDECEKRISEIVHAIYRIYKNNPDIETIHNKLKQCRAVAIDFGTSSSRVAVTVMTIHDKHIYELIKNDKGKTETPNYVYVDENNGYVCGEEALEVCNDYGNLVYNFKIKLLKDVPYKNDFIKYVSEIFKNLKKFSRQYLNIDDNSQIETLYVFTIPLGNSNYESVLTDCAENAGIKQYSFLNDAQAVALYYSCESSKRDEDILIVDIGAGKSYLALYMRVYEKMIGKSQKNDLKLCGEEFTSILVEYCKSQIDEQMNTKFETSAGVRALFKLRIECEKAKIRLSTEDKAEIVVEGLFENYNLKTEITRKQFESLSSNLFDRLNDMLNGVEKSIRKVILTGGSSKIPKVKEIISSYFDNKAQIIEYEPDVVAKGASIYATWKNNGLREKLKSII